MTVVIAVTERAALRLYPSSVDLFHRLRARHQQLDAHTGVSLRIAPRLYLSLAARRF